MNERLLQFIWQYSLYSPAALKTADREPVVIVHPGKRNTDAGPDFSEAKIKIGNTTLIGNIELHVRASDWKKHRHDKDHAYRNIILHVVYEDDKNQPTQGFPKLVLKEHIADHIIEQYTSLIQTPRAIPCATQLSIINSFVKEGFLTRLLVERWEEKLAEWSNLLDQSRGDWSTLLYWRLAYNFGFKVNAAPFLQLAQSIPWNLYAKHKGQLLQVEALLFGQAGMLDESFEDEYPRRLQQEYLYLKAKYKLTPLKKHQWKFLRLRPANFATIRIAQFAALIHQSMHLFSQIIETTSLITMRKLLNVTASDYWSNHYRFDEIHEKSSKKKLGALSIDNLIINTIAPLQFLFARHVRRLPEQEKALALLNEVPAEKNNILTLWNNNGWHAENAAQSQALLQLYNNYCTGKKCLECTIGLGIIKASEKLP